MHRWFFADQNAICEKYVAESLFTLREPLITKEYATTKWTFNVKYTGEICPNEFIVLSGNVTELGSWSLQRCIIMKRKNCTSTTWTCSVELYRKKDIHYRYAIVAINERNYRIVRFWETHMKSRFVSQLQGKEETGESEDVFGYVNNERKVERGWLSDNSLAIQLEFFNAPFQLNKKIDGPIYIRVNLLKLPPATNNETSNTENCAKKVEKTKELKYSQQLPPKVKVCEQKGPFNFCEVVHLKNDNNRFQYQPKYGMPCDKTDMLIFHITIADDLDNIGFEINLYNYPPKAGLDVPPYHIAYQTIKPSQLVGSLGTLQLTMMCTCTHQPLGTVDLNYLIVRPLITQVFDFDRLGSQYWNILGKQSHIAHRGCGVSYKRGENIIRENTISSFREAISHGSDAIEFDISLTKDNIPVVFHEMILKFCVSDDDDLSEYDVLHLPLADDEIDSLNTKLCPVNNTPFKHIPVREFTFEQLKRVKDPYFREDEAPKNQCSPRTMKETLPFGRLRKVLKALPTTQPIVIDIKWPMLLDNGTYSEVIKLGDDNDLNEFADVILSELLDMFDGRRIVLHIFNVHLSTIFKLKQNVFPIVTLTRLRYENSEFVDERSRNCFKAAHYANVMNFIGVGLPEEDMKNFPAIVMHLHRNGLCCVTWGVNIRQEEVRKKLEHIGVDGIIYDRINHDVEPKDTKGLIFYVESYTNLCTFDHKRTISRVSIDYI